MPMFVDRSRQQAAGERRGSRRRIAALTGALTAVLLVSGFLATTGASAAAMIRDPGCSTGNLPANDDGSSPSTALGFSLNFGGTTYDHVFINNNGNVTFDAGLSAFTPTAIGATGRPIVAPFWADVDTRGMGSAVTTFGTIMFQGHPAFCVLWDGVGYYSGHADKLNKFQLLLVSRSDRAAGDFDVYFLYDQVQWETGDASGGMGGLGGTSARVGFGSGGASIELSGSGTNGAFLDGGPAALVTNSFNSATPGTYIYPVTGGAPQGEQGLHGLVTENHGALVGAPVEACPAPNTPQPGPVPCQDTVTNGQGRYSLANLAAGLWNVRVNPPPGDQVGVPTTVGPVQVPGGIVPATQDIVMSVLSPPPSGTVIGGIGTFGPGHQPVLQWHLATPISTMGCAGASPAGYQVIVPATTPGGAPTVINSGPLTEGPAGTYHGSIPPLAPFHGFAQIKITLTCPGGAPPQVGTIDIYIDPSGTVLDTTGHPIANATVLLQRASAAAGPFTPVPNGSAIMSPNNRTNPSVSDTAGRFGWDVLTGFYTVTASKPGCLSAATPVLPVPPEATDLRITLDCTARLSSVTAKAGKNGKITLSFATNEPGVVTAIGTDKVRATGRALVAARGGKKKPKLVTLSWPQGSMTLAAAGRGTITLSPSSAAAKQLKKLKKLKVSVVLAFTSVYPASTLATTTVTVSATTPKKKKH